MQTGLCQCGVPVMEEKCWEKSVTFPFRSREADLRLWENSHLLVNLMEIFSLMKKVAEVKGLLLPIQTSSLLFNVLLDLRQKSMPERTNSNISWYNMSFRLSPAMRQRKRRFTVY